jgi:hypothetical protein
MGGGGDEKEKKVTFAVDVVVCEESDEPVESPSNAAVSWRDWIGV